MPTTSDVIELLRVEVPREIESRVPRRHSEVLGTGRCIQATHVGGDVLRYFGIESTPIVTLMMAGNAAWAEWMIDGGVPPMPDEVWSVGIDPNGEEGFPGHLVLDVGGQLLDLDAGFYSRPHHGMVVPPTVLMPIGQQVPGGPIAAAELDGGGAIVYGRHPKPPNYQGTRAWKHTGTWAGPVIRRMREVL